MGDLTITFLACLAVAVWFTALIALIFLVRHSHEGSETEPAKTPHPLDPPGPGLVSEEQQRLTRLAKGVSCLQFTSAYRRLALQDWDSSRLRRADNGFRRWLMIVAAKSDPMAMFAIWDRDILQFWFEANQTHDNLGVESLLGRPLEFNSALLLDFASDGASANTWTGYRSLFCDPRYQFVVQELGQSHYWDRIFDENNAEFFLGISEGNPAIVSAAQLVNA